MRLLLVLLLLAALSAALASPGGILVMKSCSPTCPNSTVSSDGRALSVSCCQGSQCNRSAASGLGGSPGALWASTAASLLWALLRAPC
ncbi:ly6/PLAUR domain-containing protein 2-like [Cebus imitator]|uniref:Ly6/PLAUR domain-containing protein 2-like n=1 Tax=Sapajus apella TaxID=9515 RepID=A0A6J3FCX6_SAPAP|nr:ly6/PLAUR domain-containing protein 2-like [Sapajus apella]XP_037588402.1 ly6/PLAUR domain-containing protein 2-like [Cebus imitator]